MAPDAQESVRDAMRRMPPSGAWWHFFFGPGQIDLVFSILASWHLRPYIREST